MDKLILLPLFISSPLPAQTDTDLTIYNGKIATMVEPGEFIQTVAMKDGIILATGTSQTVLADYNNSATLRIDAGGKTTYASGTYITCNPVLAAIIPDWSLVKYIVGYQK